MAYTGNRRGINPREDDWASCEDNPLSELMFDRGQSVIMNVRGRLCWEDERINHFLMRVLCRSIISRLTPIVEDQLVPERVVRRLRTVLARTNVKPNNIDKMVASVESCYRMTLNIIPLGS